ncbi:hypothetical protein Tco_0946838, partial [Tanacetum coccineum]
MSSITAQQTKLDLELVTKEKRLDIGKCNGRLNVPEVYMHQFWDSVYKHDTFYRFKMDKRKRFKLNLEVFRDIFKICPRVQGQDFDALPTDEEIVSFLRDLGHTGKIHSLNDVVVDQMYQPCRTFAALINRSLSGKIIGLNKLRLSKAQILCVSLKILSRTRKLGHSTRKLWSLFNIYCNRLVGNGYSLKDKNKAKTDKTEHENGKSIKSQSQQVKDEAEAKTEEILNGPTHTQVNGPAKLGRAYGFYQLIFDKLELVYKALKSLFALVRAKGK